VATDEEMKQRWAKKSGKKEHREMQKWGLAYHAVKTPKGFLTDASMMAMHQEVSICQ